MSIELACNDRIELLKDTLFMAKKNANGTEEPLEKQLWKTADKLRKNIDAAEYKHVVLGLIFLKYISDAFEELYAKLKAEESQGADPKTKMNTKPKMFSLFHPKRVGTCWFPLPNNPPLVLPSMLPWMPLKRKIHP